MCVCVCGFGCVIFSDGQVIGVSTSSRLAATSGVMVGGGGALLVFTSRSHLPPFPSLPFPPLRRYTTARLGLFKQISEELQNRNGKGKPLPLHLKALAGLSAGGLAAMVGSPADLSLIRMQADGTLPAAERRNYKGVMDAMGAIVKEDGIGGLFRGAGPTIVRAMALNMGMLASNEQAKEILVANGVTGMNATLGASALAGFVASAFSLPFDYVKTQLQKQKPDANGKLPYAGTVDCAIKTFAEGGPLKFYTGFPTYYVRIAPHAMFTLIFQDALTKFVKKQGI